MKRKSGNKMTMSENLPSSAQTRWLVPQDAGHAVPLSIQKLARRVWIDSHEVTLSSQKI